MRVQCLAACLVTCILAAAPSAFAQQTTEQATKVLVVVPTKVQQDSNRGQNLIVVEAKESPGPNREAYAYRDSMNDSVELGGSYLRKEFIAEGGAAYTSFKIYQLSNEASSGNPAVLKEQLDEIAKNVRRVGVPEFKVQGVATTIQRALTRSVTRRASLVVTIAATAWTSVDFFSSSTSKHPPQGASYRLLNAIDEVLTADSILVEPID